MRAALLLLVASGAALACPPPPPDEAVRPGRAPFEWASWIRLGVGMAPRTADSAARSTEPPPPRGQDTAYEAALGADVTLPMTGSGDLRLGTWLEVRSFHEIVAGGELVVQKAPKTIDLFQYEGEGVLALRAGASPEHLTAQVAYGYLAPWDLWHQHHGATRYMIGARFVASYTRATHDPSDWIATIGLEFEPVGALRYLLGIRAWY